MDVLIDVFKEENRSLLQVMFFTKKITSTLMHSNILCFTVFQHAHSHKYKRISHKETVFGG